MAVALEVHHGPTRWCPSRRTAQTGPPAGYTYVSLVVPGERCRFVEAREVASLAGGSVVALGIGAFAVRRRRPG